jgi:pimeloyl-ACP methyl ester carboxylesterase
VPDRFAAELFRVCMRRGRPKFRLHPVALPDAELRALQVPVLLLVGEHEAVANPQKTVSRALALLPDVEAAVLPGAGHLLPSEQPAVVNARVLTFLDRIHARADTAAQPAVPPLARSA